MPSRGRHFRIFLNPDPARSRFFQKNSIPIPPDPDFFKNFNPDPEFIPIPILKLHSLPIKCDTKREKMLHLRVIGISHYFPRRLKAFLLVLGHIISQFFRSGRHRDCILQSRSRPEIFGIAFLNPDPVPSEKNASGSGSRSGYPDFGIKGADPWFSHIVN